MWTSRSATWSSRALTGDHTCGAMVRPWARDAHTAMWSTARRAVGRGRQRTPRRAPPLGDRPAPRAPPAGARTAAAVRAPPAPPSGRRPCPWPPPRPPTVRRRGAAATSAWRRRAAPSPRRGVWATAGGPSVGDAQTAAACVRCWRPSAPCSRGRGPSTAALLSPLRGGGSPGETPQSGPQTPVDEPVGGDTSRLRLGRLGHHFSRRRQCVAKLSHNSDERAAVARLQRRGRRGGVSAPSSNSIHQRGGKRARRAGAAKAFWR